MAVHLVDQGIATPLERLVADYLMSRRARALSPRTDEQYSYALEGMLLKWCALEGITRLSELDSRTFDRYTTHLLSRTKRTGETVSKHGVHTLIRPVRLLLNWASREGEEVQARPQLPRRDSLQMLAVSRADRVPADVMRPLVLFDEGYVYLYPEVVSLLYTRLALDAMDDDAPWRRAVRASSRRRAAGRGSRGRSGAPPVR
jgi:hypothetical protein